jgi:mannosyl-oligosaccharide alpha-1,2-mannosidase
MGMKSEFEEAILAVEEIDFTTCSLDEINVFETTIRYLGGFLAAHDLTKGKYPTLLTKAEELGIMLYKAFDTPNRIPVTRWKFKAAMDGKRQESSTGMLIAEIGSLSLEFTRLSQLTGDPRYYDAVQRIADMLDEQQDATRIPGLWPVVVNARDSNFTEGRGFLIGGMADSTFEYLPKNHLILGGATDQYRRMYEKAIEAMKKFIFFRPMNEKGLDILFAGSIDALETPESEWVIKAEGQHLGCFAGGMVGIGAKMFNREADMAISRKLTEGCLWGYEGATQGLFPEVTMMIPCADRDFCPWDEKIWLDAMKQTHGLEDKAAAEDKQRSLGLPKGMLQAKDTRYILRPEAIESVFILYRLTGEKKLQDRAWNMFKTIIAHTLTPIAHAALDDCTASTPPKADRMESFWLAETLKYFYLIFSEPDVVSLDQYVLNTEAHPLKRP